MRDSQTPGNQLEHDVELSRLYGEGAREVPSANIDQAILAQARTVAERNRESARPVHMRGPAPFGRRAHLSWSLAAVVVLSVSLVTWLPEEELTAPDGAMIRETGKTLPRSPALRNSEPGSSPSATLSDTAASEQSGRDTASQTSLTRQERAEPRITKKAVPKPNAMMKSGTATGHKPVEQAVVQQGTKNARAPGKETARGVEPAADASHGPDTAAQTDRQNAAQGEPSSVKALEPEGTAEESVEASRKFERRQRFQTQPIAGPARSGTGTPQVTMNPASTDQPTAHGNRTGTDAFKGRPYRATPGRDEISGDGPAQWLGKITNLLDSGELEAAHALYYQFRERFPAFVVDPALLERLRN